MNYTKLITGFLFIIIGGIVFYYDLKKFKGIKSNDMRFPMFTGMFGAMIGLALIGAWVVILELSKLF
ncbi:hypothetical protein GWK08_05985 [Leptobacterium flavescens]|uniref:Uncharacterized protein n=1 Tax=Leptobacterium flavescens TaxID=472055 RepID=A0A6P0UKN9_9FLAO|nr:hypothetical protein [Leptobacterium flavescens]NER12980.1 hypothetical protein [Leptobacterium flavescens]